MTPSRWVFASCLALVSLVILATASAPQQSLHKRIQSARLRAELACGKSALLSAEPPSLETIERTEWSQLLTATAAGTPHERWRAIKILGELGDRRAVPALLRALTDKRGTRPCLAAQSLGILRDPDALGELVRATYDTGNGDLRACAMKALGLLREPTGVPALIDAIGRRDMVMVAADALARIGDVDGARVVAAAAEDPKLRPWLARPLGEFGLPEVVPTLRSIAADPTLPDAAREEAREGLWKTSVLTGPSRARALIRVLRTGSAAEHRGWAAYRLGDEGISSGIPALAEALAEVSDVVRMAATVALVRLGQDSEASLLRRISRPGAEGEYAIAALGFVGGPDALMALQRLRAPDRLVVADRSIRWLSLRGVQPTAREAGPEEAEAS